MSPAEVMDLIARRLRPLIVRLPMQPPALLLATALNRWLLPRLEPAAREALARRCVEIAVTDLGLTLKLVLDARRPGFGLAEAASPVALRIAASSLCYARLLAGQDDADRLFFERALVMEGDTELGLVLKNTLDAIGPLFTPPFGMNAASAMNAKRP